MKDNHGRPSEDRTIRQPARAGLPDHDPLSGIHQRLPKTGQPDFGEITIEYCPDRVCIELKSLKFYLQAYRNKGIFYESLTNEILDDLTGACRPRWMRVTARFTPRGGITTDVTAEYSAGSG